MTIEDLNENLLCEKFYIFRYRYGFYISSDPLAITVIKLSRNPGNILLPT